MHACVHVCVCARAYRCGVGGCCGRGLTGAGHSTAVPPLSLAHALGPLLQIWPASAPTTGHTAMSYALPVHLSSSGQPVQQHTLAAHACSARPAARTCSCWPASRRSASASACFTPLWSSPAGTRASSEVVLVSSCCCCCCCRASSTSASACRPRDTCSGSGRELGSSSGWPSSGTCSAWRQHCCGEQAGQLAQGLGGRWQGLCGRWQVAGGRWQVAGGGWRVAGGSESHTHQKRHNHRAMAAPGVSQPAGCWLAPELLPEQLQLTRDARLLHQREQSALLDHHTACTSKARTCQAAATDIHAAPATAAT
jgi:hypothetical protein